ncbi:hypothetical protein [Methanolobus profundi]|uniref:Uncharacterized protein n=1 Tax=Methanolobus profundi TaxID=487685 RepID=A0A1I4RBE5_9EURY|nr:hypothetical protein [Methanolobus profundi]SFM49571.1 hypothetical protein SAMN04488696_1479 [Methanolobus profundi]
MKIILENNDELEIVKHIDENKVSIDQFLMIFNMLNLDRDVEIMVLLEEENKILHEKEDKILPDAHGAYPIGYVPDGPLQRGVLYRTENNKFRMYPPGTSAYYQNKARKRWEAERMEIYNEHKYEWLAAFISDKILPDINGLLKFNHWPQSCSRKAQAWLWVYEKLENDQEIINSRKHDRVDYQSMLHEYYRSHFRPESL